MNVGVDLSAAFGLIGVSIQSIDENNDEPSMVDFLISFAPLLYGSGSNIWDV
jgi:hypothetical protein